MAKGLKLPNYGFNRQMNRVLKLIKRIQRTVDKHHEENVWRITGSKRK